jgi:hypothetical protein
METPLVVIDFRTKSIYAVPDPPRDPKIAQAMRDSQPVALTSQPADK